MNKIIACWAIPRSRSTAFRWMMENRGDFKTLHEPFGRSAYYSEDRIIEQFSHLPPQPEYNYSAVIDNILKMAEKDNIWIKDFGFQVKPVVNKQFFSHFQHSFLIRHPKDMLPSAFHLWPNMTLQEVGYKELYELFEQVCEYLGFVPPVIDSDDLVDNPYEMSKTYCEALEIPFISDAMHWEKPKSTKELSWFEGGRSHKNLANTTGFKRQSNPTYSSIEDNKVMKEYYDFSLPYYEKLYANKIKIRSKQDTDGSRILQNI